MVAEVVGLVGEEAAAALERLVTSEVKRNDFQRGTDKQRKILCSVNQTFHPATKFRTENHDSRFDLPTLEPLSQQVCPEEEATDSRDVDFVKVLWVESVWNDFEEFFVVVQRFDELEWFVVLKIFRQFDVLTVLTAALPTVAFVAEDETLLDEVGDRSEVFNLPQKSTAVRIANEGQVIVAPEIVKKEKKHLVLSHSFF